MKNTENQNDIELKPGDLCQVTSKFGMWSYTARIYIKFNDTILVEKITPALAENDLQTKYERSQGTVIHFYSIKDNRRMKVFFNEDRFSEFLSKIA